MNADYWIEHLKMEKHPEGGYYKSSFVSADSFEPATHLETRQFYTSIYFLLRSQDVSHFHRLKSDELWYFHAGSPLTVHMIDEEGNYRDAKVGLNIENGESPQVLVPKGSIFGSTVDQPDAYSLVGCMVSPGFDFADFQLFTQQQLMADYPDHEKIIRQLAYKKLPE